jgi:hypothetical protein
LNINEIEQIIKDIPDELYKIPEYGKLLSNIQVQTHYIALRITLSTGTVIATVQIFEDLDFVCRFYHEDEIINYLKTPIKEIVAKISAYLSIFGFSDITLTI